MADRNSTAAAQDLPPAKKRLLGYSSVAQIGYIVLGISFASVTGLTGGIVHLFNHALIKGGLFMAMGCIMLPHDYLNYYLTGERCMEAGDASGTGLLDVRGLSLNGVGDSFQIVFEVQLAGAIANNSLVLNQSEAIYAGNAVAVSDDPNINGPADPFVGGDEDPTEILIQSAPYLDIDKISTYLDGDPNVLLAGETLRYEIQVDGHAQQDEVRLFFFHYDCRVDGTTRLSVRGGQAARGTCLAPVCDPPP